MTQQHDQTSPTAAAVKAVFKWAGYDAPPTTTAEVTDAIDSGFYSVEALREGMGIPSWAYLAPNAAKN